MDANRGDRWAGLPTEIHPEEPPHGLYEGIEYKEFWNGWPRRHLDELEHAIIRKLLPASGWRIVDVGCGYGRLSDCYMGRFHQAILIDGSMSLLRQAAEKTRGQAVYIACDVTHIPLHAASCDTVLMIRVFHHIADSPAFLAELHRLLSNRGQLIFSYMNKGNLKRVIKWLIGANQENPFSVEPGGVGTTLISHHPKAVHRMLNEKGFSNIQCLGAGVLDQLLGRAGLEERWIATAERFAKFFAWSWIAPWIICHATAHSNASLLEVQELSDLLLCPACGGRVSDQDHGWLCQNCQRCYPVIDGIIDFRLR